MQATLIYNHNAGSTGDDEIEALKEALREAGYAPVYKETNCEADLDTVLTDVEGLVVAAGGDGTARAVMTRILKRENVHFTPLPMGSANNICRNLGIEGEPLDILRRLKSPRPCGFDMGHLQAPWGEDYFLEGAGLGFFAEILASYDPEEGKSVLRGLESLVAVFQNGFSRETYLQLPDQIVQEEFLAVEVLNTSAIGPRLKFAPDADPTDGLLHVVCIRKNEQDGFLNYLQGLVTESLYDLESVTVYKVPELTIRWRGFPVHVDAVVHPPHFDFRQQDKAQAGDSSFRSSIRPYPDVAPEASLHIKVIPQALSVWLPATP